MLMDSIARISILITLLALAFSTSSRVYASFEISPYSHSFGLTELNTPTASQTFNITNRGSGSITFGSAVVSGVYSDQFNISANNCTGQTVVTDANCTIDVNMNPTTVGSKSAWLEIVTDDPDNPVAVVFLNNYESTEQQARRRLPPVLYSLNGLPETMTIGQSYTITWELLGYHDDYLSTIAFFDCTGTAPSSCGNSYGSHFASSGVLSSSSTAAGEWSYKGVQSKRFGYSYTFTPTAEQFSGSADIVVRFYRKNSADSAAGKGSLSLMIPGNLSDNYYDTSGRRILKNIVPCQKMFVNPKIMPLGDSITHGYLSSTPNGYRGPLYNALSSYNVDFVGSQSNGSGFDADHEGYPGQTAAWISSRVSGYLNNNPADIILLHIGTNDIYYRDQPAIVETRILSLLGNINSWADTQGVNVTVLLAKIIDLNPSNPKILELNDLIGSMGGSAWSNMDVQIVDQYSALTDRSSGGDWADLWHPSLAGHAKMAQRWEDSLIPLLDQCDD